MQRFTIGLRTEWTLGADGAENASLADVLALLSAIETEGHIAGACKACGMSYRHAWGVLRAFEAAFGVQLLVTQRRRGTTLSAVAQKLLWANRRIQARLSPTLESCASELQSELEKLLPEQSAPLRLHASHGFAVEALVQQLTSGKLTVELRYRTAIEAVTSLAHRECDVAGFQVPQGEYQDAVLDLYAPWLDPDRHALVHLAVRNSGLFVAKGNPKRISGVADLGRADVRFVNRQVGSSTRLWVDMMLRRAGIASANVSGFDTAEFTHAAVAAHVASDMADAGIGVETAARRFGLDFIPMVREAYYFAIDRQRLGEQPLQEFVALLRSEGYRDFVATLAGYDASLTGEMQTFQQAFGGWAPAARRTRAGT